MQWSWISKNATDRWIKIADGYIRVGYIQAITEESTGSLITCADGKTYASEHPPSKLVEVLCKND